MIKGMTGFGSAQLSVGKIKAVIEIKSVNHRYFDVTHYLPIGFGSMERKMVKILEKDLKRGRVTISMKIIQKPESTIVLNKEVVKKYLHYARCLHKEFKLNNDLSLSDLIKLPEVLTAKETIVKPEEISDVLEKSIKKALKGLVMMRKSEGKSMSEDISTQLARMSLRVKEIQKRSTCVLKAKRKIAEDDEFRSFQKSCDIHEELSRLEHYIVELKRLLKSPSAVGKKMDFLAQEMQRETNTIGSKLMDKIVGNAVIALKSKIEKIREQAQNVE